MSSPIPDLVWQFVLFVLQALQHTAQWRTSFFMPCQMTICGMSLMMEHLDGCERPWMRLNTLLQNRRNKREEFAGVCGEGDEGLLVVESWLGSQVRACFSVQPSWSVLSLSGCRSCGILSCWAWSLMESVNFHRSGCQWIFWSITELERSSSLVKGDSFKEPALGRHRENAANTPCVSGECYKEA